MSEAPVSIPWRAQPQQLNAIKMHKIPELFFGGARGGGKLLHCNTRLPTPRGWTTMGSVRQGDELFDETGAICRVAQVFDVDPEPELYRLTFDDGSFVDACVDHKWHAYTKKDRTRMLRSSDEWRARRRASRPSRAKVFSQKPGVSRDVTERNKLRQYDIAPVTGNVYTTRQIVDTLYAREDIKEPNYSVVVSSALELPTVDLPLDPYLLGVWLGDGTSASGTITGMDEEIFTAFSKDFVPGAIQAKKNNRATTRTFLGFKRVLAGMGLLGHKHVPDLYLRGSIEQRLALIQGLMDTDGTVAKCSGSAEFCNTNERIIDGMVELIVSMGWKVTKREGRARLNGEDYGQKWTLKWMPDRIVFRLPRKASIQKIGTRPTNNFRYIVKAEPIVSSPGRCIAVDSPSHLFLCGDAMIPTHNSDFLLGDFAQDIPQYGRHWHGILFRKNYPQLEELVARSREIYPTWFPGAEFMTGTYTWKWPNGATLKFRHLENDADWVQYQGHQYGWIAFDELPQWATPKVYNELKACLRSGTLSIPNKRIRATGNPGGVGHGWIKNYFGIDMYPNGSVVIPSWVEGGNAKIFVKSSVVDNKIMLENDPGYVARLRDLGDEALVKMYLLGDWNVVAGAFFPEFDVARHVIAPFEIPKDWMRYRAADWGSAAPGCVHWYAVSDGSIPAYPRGALICYREWYTAKPTRTGEWVGLKLTAEEFADGIKERDDDVRLDMSVIDPSAFKEDGGPSIASRMSARKVHFQKADNARKAGWDAVRSRLKGDQVQTEGRPMIYFFSTCPHIIRTLPLMQHDTGKAAGSVEDIDTHSEDHAADTVRYACMSRPWVKPGVQSPPKPNHVGILTTSTTFNDLLEQRTRARRETEEG